MPEGTPATSISTLPATGGIITPAVVARSKRAVFFRRLSSAVALWSLLLGVLLAGYPIGFFVLVAGFGLGGLWEFYGMLDHKRLPNYRIFGMICATVFLVGSSWFWYEASAFGNPTFHAISANNFETGGLLIFLLGVFGRQFFTHSSRDIPPLETMAYTVFGLFYVPWLFNCITKIIYVAPRIDGALVGQYYVLYLIAVSKFSDMGAYLVGSLIGKHKMVPHISPAKTWEGFGGALAFSLLASFGLRALMPVKLGLLDHVDCLVMGLTLSVVAVIGDLAESILKRSTGVKDSGRLLPGIGGVLDLIDSLLFTAPVLYFYLCFLLRHA